MESTPPPASPAPQGSPATKAIGVLVSIMVGGFLGFIVGFGLSMKSAFAKYEYPLYDGIVEAVVVGGGGMLVGALLAGWLATLRRPDVPSRHD